MSINISRKNILKLVNILAFLLIAFFIINSNSEVKASNEGYDWKFEENKWYYKNLETEENLTGWQEINGFWFYFSSKTGVMLTDWQYLGGKWYYFKPENGIMQKNWKNIDNKWYYFDSSTGSMKTGWIKNGNDWYFLRDSGSMATNWQKVFNKWYYLDPVKGNMKTDWQKVQNTWFYLNPSNGDMKTGWIKLGNYWYYLDNPNGDLKTGEFNVGDETHYSTPSGVWVEQIVSKALSSSSPLNYTLNTFRFMGVVNWSGYKFTYYSQSVLPGPNLRIPGRHVSDLGYVSDADGYIVLAASRSIAKGTIIDTPFGAKGKVYDTCAGCTINWYDVYIK